MAIPGYNEPFPVRDAIVKNSGKATDVFTRWIEQALLRRLDASPVRPQSAEVLTGQNASTSGALGGAQSSGLYRVSYSAQVITAAGVSSSLALTLGWTHNGIAQSEVFAAMTGNTTGTHQGLVYALEIDAGTVVSYTLTYASNAAGAMVYDATLSLELVQLIG